MWARRRCFNVASERTIHQLLKARSTAGCDCIGHTSVNVIVALMLGGPVSGGFLEVFRLKRYKGKAKRHGLLPNALIAYSLIPHVRLMQTSRGVA
jgi:hypothetical protein